MATTTATDKRIAQYLEARKAGDLATMSRIQDGLKGRELTVLARALKAAGPAPAAPSKTTTTAKATDTPTPKAAEAAKETPMKATKATKAAAKKAAKIVKKLAASSVPPTKAALKQLVAAQAAAKGAPKAATKAAKEAPAPRGTGPGKVWREVAKVLGSFGAVRSHVKLAECGHEKLCRKGRTRVLCPTC